MKFCENCGTKIEDNARVCPKCGEKVESEPQVTMNVQNPNEKKPIGLIVGVAGGCIGIVGIVLAILFATGVIRAGSGGDPVPPVSQESPTAITEAAPTETPVATPEPTPEPTPTLKPTMSPEEVKYKKARSLLSRKKYESAASAFRKMGSYKKSKDLYKKSMYLYGKKLYGKHAYEKSEKVFKSLKNYKKSKLYKTYCMGQLFKKHRPTMTRYEFEHNDHSDGEAMTHFYWTGVSGASGYEFMIEDDRKTRNYTTSNTNYTVSVGDGAYYVKAFVRAYKRIGGRTYYTGWSNTLQLW